MQTPVFIFSLPRSGSTLLQRILMSHKEIFSIAEPWILLPQIYNLKKEGTISEYSSLTAYRGIQDFINNLPNKEIDYNESLRSFLLDLYAKQCQNNERYFLDKTPRYYLIIDDIVNLFPEAKFIFLFRNPVHIYASAISTWGNNRFNKIKSTHNDIVLGNKLISEGFNKHRDKSVCLRYEDLVANPQLELQKLSKYLGIEMHESVLEDFHKQNTNGELGDPTGVLQYNSISLDSLEKWKSIFNSYIRKTFALKLLKQINRENLMIQGYDKSVIIHDIKALKSKKNHLFFRDALDFFQGYIVRKFNLNLFFSSNFSWIKKKFLS